MTSKVVLSDVTREQIPGIVQDLIDGKAVAWFYNRANSNHWFYYENGSNRSSRTGRYRLKTPNDLIWALSQGLRNFLPGNLLDADGQEFQVGYSSHYDSPDARDENGNWQQPNFSRGNFSVEWIDSTSEQDAGSNIAVSRSRETGYLIDKFLRDHPEGNKSELIRWLKGRPEVSAVSKTSVIWEDPAGGKHSKSLKTLQNTLSEHRKKLR